MKFSVIAPVFNEQPHLAGFLEAMAAQDCSSEYEIICVDNGSTDGSLEFLESQKGPVVLQESKRGSYAARNRGIRAARGEILVFVDPDCMPVPSWLSSVERRMAEPGLQIVLGKRVYETPSRLLQRLADYDASMASFVFSSDTAEIYFGYTNNMAVRRSLFESQGFFHEVLRGADSVFVRQVAEALGGEAIVFEPEMAVCHQEIRRITDFYAKRVLYGKSNRQTAHLGSARPLGFSERIRVFRQTARENGYSPPGMLELLLVLAGGLACYEYGRWRGRWLPQAGPSRDAPGGAAGEV